MYCSFIFLVLNFIAGLLDGSRTQQQLSGKPYPPLHIGSQVIVPRLPTLNLPQNKQYRYKEATDKSWKEYISAKLWWYTNYTFFSISNNGVILHDSSIYKLCENSKWDNTALVWRLVLKKQQKGSVLHIWWGHRIKL